MNIAIASAFRNSGQAAVNMYLDRIADFRRSASLNGWNFRVLAGEGDSRDNTRDFLEYGAAQRNIPISFVECSHGQREFHSTEEPDRLKALSHVLNSIMGGVGPYDDVLLYVESDLQWHPKTLTKLVWAAINKEDGFDIVAPMIYAGHDQQNRPVFYDIWGFRKNGQRFGGLWPYHPGLNGNQITSLDSAGSCLAMRSEVARRVRVRNDYAFVGWCEDARSQGYRIGVRQDLQVRQA